jgi:hypothetical protein
MISLAGVVKLTAAPRLVQGIYVTPASNDRCRMTVPTNVPQIAMLNRPLSSNASVTFPTAPSADVLNLEARSTPPVTLVPMARLPYLVGLLAANPYIIDT